MCTNELRNKLIAFYDGETSPEEEKQLLEYFLKDEVDEEFLKEKKIFLELYRKEITEIPQNLEAELESLIEELAAREKPTRKTMKREILFLRLTGLAAGLALLLTVHFFFGGKEQEETTGLAERIKTEDTFNNPEVAYEEAEKALILLSSNFNKGIKQLAVLDESLDKTAEILNKTMNKKNNKES